MSKFLKLSEGLFLFGNGGVNRIEEIDNRYGASVYKTALFNNLQKISAVKESLEDIQKLLDNVSEKKEN
jgi:hypothetical protein